MKESEKRALEVFFEDPTNKFYIREIARLTNLNPNTIINSCEKLEKQELIKREKKKHVVEFSANISEKFKQLKRIYNLEKIYCSGIVEFLVDEFKPEAISVIGSYSLGQDIKKSDIDIVIINVKSYKEISLSNFERKIGRKVHLINVKYNNISEEFYTNLINGIILYGFIRMK